MLLHRIIGGVPAGVARAAVTAVIAALLVTGVGVLGGGGARSAAAATPAYLPFDMPSAPVLRSSPRKVFAHYFPPLPMSLDNADPERDYYATQYMNPSGENGKHAAYGGHTRDWPVPRPVRPEAHWRVLDAEAEVRQAIAGGLDGFTVDLLELGDSGGRLWQTTLALMDGANNVDPGFKIVLMPDLSGGMKDKDTATMARWLAHLGSKPAAYRLADGRLVVSPFHAESWTPEKWKQVLDILRDTYGQQVAFVPTFLEERTHAAAFAAISYGMGNWGSRTAAWNDPHATGPDSPIGRVDRVQALGKIWMQPVAVQDARPAQGIFDEALNTQNLRNTWEVARRSGAEWVQMVTWNDYTEGTQMAPSGRPGWAWTDLNAYYVTWFKTGVVPAITRDAIYLSHRTQTVAAKPTFPQTLLMKVRGGMPTRDSVEAHTFLRAPGRVTITVGSQRTTCDVPAGPATCLAPLATGQVSATAVTASGTTSVTSAKVVSATPQVQDLTYTATSSLRSGTSTGVPPAPVAPPATPMPPVVTPAGTVSVAPVADAYGNEHAAGANWGSDWSLASRGTPGYSAHLRFNLPATPAGKVLTKAVLRIRTNDLPFAGSATPHWVRTGSNSWNEQLLTWSNRPAVWTTTLGTLPTAASSSFAEIPLRTGAIATRAGTQRTFVIGSDGADDLWFWSRNHGDPAHRPALLLTYG